MLLVTILQVLISVTDIQFQLVRLYISLIILDVFSKMLI